VNFFDNAENYAGGKSEAIMAGHQDARLGAPRLRGFEQVLLGDLRLPNMANTLNRKYLMQAVDASLERFGLDFLDLVSATALIRKHRSKRRPAMSDIVSSGKALYWALLSGLQPRLSLRSRSPSATTCTSRNGATAVQHPSAKACRARVREVARGLRIGLTTFSPLAQDCSQAST